MSSATTSAAIISEMNIGHFTRTKGSDSTFALAASTLAKLCARREVLRSVTSGTRSLVVYICLYASSKSSQSSFAIATRTCRSSMIFA